MKNNSYFSLMTVSAGQAEYYIHNKADMLQQIKDLNGNSARRIGIDNFINDCLVYFEDLGNCRLHVRVEGPFSRWLYFQTKTWYLDTSLSYEVTEDGKLNLYDISAEENGVHIVAEDFKLLCDAVYLHLCTEAAMLNREHYVVQTTGRQNVARVAYRLPDKGSAITLTKIPVSQKKKERGTRRRCEHVITQPGYWARRGKDKHLVFVKSCKRREVKDAVDLGETDYRID